MGPGHGYESCPARAIPISHRRRYVEKTANSPQRIRMTKTWSPAARAAAAQRARHHRPWTRSTGPRSDAGKAISRMNALKHGMRSRLRREPYRMMADRLRQLARFTRAVRALAHGRDRLRRKKISTNELICATPCCWRFYTPAPALPCRHPIHPPSLPPSFPRRRESMRWNVDCIDSRLRGNDRLGEMLL